MAAGGGRAAGASDMAGRAGPARGGGGGAYSNGGAYNDGSEGVFSGGGAAGAYRDSGTGAATLRARTRRPRVAPHRVQRRRREQRRMARSATAAAARRSVLWTRGAPPPRAPAARLVAGGWPKARRTGAAGCWNDVRGQRTDRLPVCPDCLSAVCLSPSQADITWRTRPPPPPPPSPTHADLNKPVGGWPRAAASECGTGPALGPRQIRRSGPGCAGGDGATRTRRAGSRSAPPREPAGPLLGHPRHGRVGQRSTLRLRQRPGGKGGGG